MASSSSKAIPFVAFAVLLVLVGVEVFTGKDIPLESIVPFLTACGLGGIPLSIIKNAIEAKKAVDVEKVRNSVTPPTE